MQHRFNKLATSSPAEFDYVIIGAGSAGSAIAYRLGEDRDISIALIEYSGSDAGPFIQMPAKTKRGAQTISATTPATRIICQLDQTEHPLAVSQNNKTIGQIDKSALLACLAYFTANRP